MGHRSFLQLLASVLMLTVQVPAQTTRSVPSQFPTIQGAIASSAHGDTVDVAPGTYSETLNFLGKSIIVQSTGGPSVTTIQGFPALPVVVCQSSETPNSILRGFTIRGGKHGVLCDAASPTIDDCTITANVSTATGGAGIRCAANASGQTASPIIKNSRITGNMVINERGGGIGIFVDAGGVSAPLIMDTMIESNIATGHNSSFNIGGGGIACFRAASSTGVLAPTITGSTIKDNSSVLSGGGIFSYFASSVILRNCRVVGNVAVLGLNTAIAHGGGLWSNESTLMLVGSELVQNSAADGGGGAFITDSTALTIQSCTIAGNASQGVGGVLIFNSPTTLAATIIHGNSFVDATIAWGATLSSTGSNVGTGMVTGGASNISADPLFVDPANGDFHLARNSPCRDSGTIGPLPNPTTDLDGGARVVGTIDMGADEVPMIGLPGSNEGLDLFVSTDSGGDPLLSSIALSPGDVIHTRLSSADGSQVGALPLLVGQAFPTGLAPISPPGFPAIHLDGQGAIILFGSTVPVLFSAPGIPPAGLDFYYQVPPGLAGTTFRIQGFASTAFAANGLFVMSDAHDLVF